MSGHRTAANRRAPARSSRSTGTHHRGSVIATLANRPQIIGVSVSETPAEMTIATVNTIANSWNNLPISPPMNVIGMNTATREIEIDITVKPICRAPLIAAVSGASPCSTCRAMFSIMTIASSTTKPTEMVSAISEKLSSE